MFCEKLPQSITLFSIYAVYFFTFLVAGGLKFKGGGVPGWFQTQFENTFIKKFPGISIAYWTIALLECLVPVLLVMSLIKMEFLPGGDTYFLRLGVSVASVVFFILGFGLRLVNDFAGAANSFFYFAATLVTQLAILNLDLV